MPPLHRGPWSGGIGGTHQARENACHTTPWPLRRGPLTIRERHLRCRYRCRPCWKPNRPLPRAGTKVVRDAPRPALSRARFSHCHVEPAACMPTPPVYHAWRLLRLRGRSGAMRLACRRTESGRACLIVESGHLLISALQLSAADRSGSSRLTLPRKTGFMTSRNRGGRRRWLRRAALWETRAWGA